MKDHLVKFGGALLLSRLDSKKVQQQVVLANHIFVFIQENKRKFKNELTIGYQYSSNENETEFFPPFDLFQFEP
jgi:hypothetical protein